MSSPNFKLNSSTRRSRKPLIALLVLTFIVALGVGSFIFIKSRNAENARIEQKERDEAQTKSAKKDIQNKDSEDTQNSNLPDNSPSTTSDKVPTSEKLGTTITSTSQKDGTVYAESVITGAEAEGTCVFTYTTPDDRPVVQQVASANKICRSSIPEVQFSKLGNWNLQVVFYLNNTKAEANKNVSIN
jgi:cytoskeletal protein RodZ